MGLGRFVWFVVDEYDTITAYAGLWYICDLIIHEMLRKKGKATKHDGKTKQHNTTRPRQLFFKKKLPRWDSNPQPSAC